jgi:hypothetical protein
MCEKAMNFEFRISNFEFRTEMTTRLWNSKFEPRNSKFEIQRPVVAREYPHV